MYRGGSWKWLMLLRNAYKKKTQFFLSLKRTVPIIDFMSYKLNLVSICYIDYSACFSFSIHLLHTILPSKDTRFSLLKQKMQFS